MKKILCFGASNSHQSINRRFAAYTLNQIEGIESQLIDLNDFEMPIYSIDREKSDGFPSQAEQFKDLIRECDGIIISFAEHNGAYTAAYKNIYDWVSRIEKDVWLQKPMLLLATSPGGRGAQGVLQLAFQSYSRSNKSSVSQFSLPSFGQNFDPENGITDGELKQLYSSALNEFKAALELV